MSVYYSLFQMEGKSGGMVRLTRPNNLLFLIILLGVMEKWVAEPILAKYQLAPQLSWWHPDSCRGVDSGGRVCDKRLFRCEDRRYQQT